MATVYSSEAPRDDVDALAAEEAAREARDEAASDAADPTDVCANCGQQFWAHGFGMGNKNDRVGECMGRDSRFAPVVAS